MERKKLTLNDLAQMHSTKVASNPVSSATKGTKDNPYTSDEAYSLIDEGAFKGGYVIDSNGLVSYWLGEAEVVAYNSSSEDEFIPIYDFNSIFHEIFWRSYYDSDWYPFGTDASSVSLPYADGTASSIVGAVDAVGEALEKNPKKINYGSNGKFYFETRTGRVFCGNQYIGTTSLNGIGTLITKYVGKIDMGLTVYNIAATYNNEGLEAGNKELATSAGEIAGGAIGRWAFAMLGAKLGAYVGFWTGPVGAAIGGVIGGIIGGAAGHVAGSYLVEISIE